MKTDTKYLGLSLKNPLVASASALSKKIDNIKRIEDAGISAVVLYSLFEEQIENESKALNHFLTRYTEAHAEALTYFPDLGEYNIGPDKYLEHIRKAKESVDIPIIASLNGTSKGGWTEYAAKIAQSGADALELNMYYLPANIKENAIELEEIYVTLISEIRVDIEIPIAVKISPFFTSLPNIAEKFREAGANGLVMFNRFYQPDLDIEDLEVVPSLELSTSKDLLLPLRWIAILYDRIDIDFALTSGVHSGVDIIKSVMAGANVAMTASELVGNGIPRAAQMLTEMSNWMEKHEYVSIEQMRGSMSQKSVKEPAAFERANYMKALTLFDNRLPS